MLALRIVLASRSGGPAAMAAGLVAGAEPKLIGYGRPIWSSKHLALKRARIVFKKRILARGHLQAAWQCDRRLSVVPVLKFRRYRCGDTGDSIDGAGNRSTIRAGKNERKAAVCNDDRAGAPATKDASRKSIAQLEGLPFAERRFI